MLLKVKEGQMILLTSLGKRFNKRNKEETIWDNVLLMGARTFNFPSTKKNKYFIVSVVRRVEMYLLFSWNLKTTPSLKLYLFLQKKVGLNCPKLQGNRKRHYHKRMKQYYRLTSG